jgi:hypothetical protein
MRKALFVVAVGLFAVVALWAADFWEKKKFTEWNEKEVRQIMTNSPWARRVDVVVNMSPGETARSGGLGSAQGDRGAGLGGCCGSRPAEATRPGRVEAGGGGGFEGPGGGGRGPEDAGTPVLPLLVRWHSALPVRQALARARWGAEALTSKEAQQLLQPQEEYYVIAISGLPERMLQRVSPETLRAGSFLKIGKKTPAPPGDARINPGPVSEILLAFARSHAITLEDKEVEVTARIGRMDVRRKFRLKEMVVGGKLEL